MAPSKLRKAIGAVKDQTSISLAKVGNSTCLSDLEVAIVKVTRHEEYPSEERHVREILSLTCYSRTYISACVSTISRRLCKTKNWIVALKSLILIHRLLIDGDPAYEQEFFFATRRGTRLLNLSDFRDSSRSNSWDYSAFVRTYAMYLDERLEFRMQGRRGKLSACAYDEDEEEDSPSQRRAASVSEMNIDLIFNKIHHLMQLIERFLACKPRGAAQDNRVVLMALYPMVKESFQIYYDVIEILNVLVDRFAGLDISDADKVYDIFCRLSKQFNELDEFYGWCKHAGVARASEYPEVERITKKKLAVMDDFIRDKSASLHDKKLLLLEQNDEPKEEEEKKSEGTVEDMNAIKALPPAEGFNEEPEKEEAEEEKPEPEKEEEPKKEADLLNLAGDALTSEERGNQFALALFDGAPAPAPAWEAFKDTENWEMALVQSASHLQSQKPSLAGGFDMMLLNGMYQQGETIQAMANSGYSATGSASSVAFGSAGRPAMLALPAPKGNTGTSSSADPFEASLVVPPPSYVQMSEMEKKQRLLVEEQLMWQQYARDGMQGQVGFARIQQTGYYQHNMGGY
ncbi:putative clathrin assembly protein At1g03050 [Diospyros lotus]|uniref:putative clathrin assembly protein At1g03050 n=1 Tax=Diospyros lotus TaxID=55363 RepID=UPI00225669BB|nr:putative clathrin assembly protein At1g03050 [Diospyros lotus]